MVPKGERLAMNRVRLEGGLVKDDKFAVGQTSTQEILFIHSRGVRSEGVRSGVMERGTKACRVRMWKGREDIECVRVDREWSLFSLA